MNIVSALSRLSLSVLKPPTRPISTATILYFKATPCLFAEPLKKKKRIDPAVLKAREDRKKKKIEKQIRRLEKNSRQMKPIEECEININLINNETVKRMTAVLSVEVMEQRILLEKKWAKYKRDQHLADLHLLDRLVFSQQRALDEVRSESEDLYQECIQIDMALLPFSSEGPVNTPAIKNYEVPDGEYADISKKW